MAYSRVNIQSITQCALLGAVICAVSPWCITLGAVPITLSLFAVFLTGSVFPVKKALAAVFIYILLGSAGVPVFAGFQGGVNVLAGLTGGFIWSYIPAVCLISSVREKCIKTKILFVSLALAICYVLGTVQYMFVSGTKSVLSAFAVCVLPFAVFDIAKAYIACVLGNRIRILLKKQNLL